MSVNWECKYCCKVLEIDDEFEVEGSILEIIEHLQIKTDELSEQCECRKEFKKEIKRRWDYLCSKAKENKTL